jgi:hypothetical protein
MKKHTALKNENDTVESRPKVTRRHTPKGKVSKKLEPRTITSQTAFLVLLATMGERKKLKSRQEALAFTRGFACAWASFTTQEEGKQVLNRLRGVFVNVNQPHNQRTTAVRGSAK